MKPPRPTPRQKFLYIFPTRDPPIARSLIIIVQLALYTRRAAHTHMLLPNPNPPECLCSVYVCVDTENPPQPSNNPTGTLLQSSVC